MVLVSQIRFSFIIFLFFSVSFFFLPVSIVSFFSCITSFTLLFLPYFIPHFFSSFIPPLSFHSISMCCILTFDPAKHAISKWCAGRKWHIPMASNRKRSRRRIWLIKWDKVKKSNGTLIDSCTRREWPVNCMTVISAWWRSNMPFQRLSGRLSARWTII